MVPLSLLMTDLLSASRLIPTALLLVAATAIGPEGIVDRYLPAEYQGHRPMLVQGFRLLKGMLVVDAFLWLALPIARRLFSGAQDGRQESPLFDPPSREVKARDWLLLALLTLFAAAVRLYRLNTSLGYDEISVADTLYQQSLHRLIARADTHRLFYALWAWAACHVNGPLEIVARVPALAFGVGSVPILFFCVRDWVGRREALLAALLMSLSTFHVWYSQEATSYTLTLLLAILQTAAWRRCASSAAAGPWLTWATLAFLTTFSHLFLGAILLFGQALSGGWLLLRREIPFLAGTRFLVTSTYAIAAFLTVSALNLFRWVDVMARAGAAETRGPVGANLIFLGHWVASTYAAWPGVAIFGVAALCGAAFLLRRDPQLVLELSLPSLVVLALFLSEMASYMTPRYCILALIPATVFVATAVVRLAEGIVARGANQARFGMSAVAYAMVLAPLLYASATSLSVYFSRDRYPFRPVGRHLATHATSGEAQLFGGYGADKFQHYAPSLERLEGYDRLQAELEGGRCFWLVYFLPSYLSKMPQEMRQRLEREGRLALHYQGLPEQLVTQYEGFVWYVARQGDGRGHPGR